MKTRHDIPIAILAAFITATTALHATAVENTLPVPMPDFMTPAQLTKWRADTTAKTVAVEKAQATASRPSTVDSSTSFYTGKPYLAESASYSFMYRDYNPEMNRWTTVDPSGFPDGANNRVYAAVPTSESDNNGLYISYDGFNAVTIGAVALWNGAELFASSLGVSLVVTAMQHTESGTDWNNDPALNTAVKNSTLYSGNHGVYNKMFNQLYSDLDHQTSDPTDVVNSITTGFDPKNDLQLFWAMHGITFNPFIVNVSYGDGDSVDNSDWVASGTVSYSKYWDFSHHLNDLFSGMGYSYYGYDGAVVNADGIYLQGAGLISPFNVTGSFSDIWVE